MTLNPTIKIGTKIRVIIIILGEVKEKKSMVKDKSVLIERIVPLS